MEEQIARFMIKVSKFEFYLVNKDIELAHIKGTTGVITGLNWNKLAQHTEVKHPFSKFDFKNSPFRIFRETAPQYLTRAQNGRLKWDSDDHPIDSWERLLVRGFAQLRNNIAHGNKAQMPAPFTYDRTKEFLEAGDALINFIAEHVFGDAHWETPIMFR